MKYPILFSILLPLILPAQQTASEILEKAIAYHDPNDEWPALVASFYFRETLPDKPDRKTIFKIDNTRGWWKLNRDNKEIYEVTGESATVLKGDKGVDRAIMMRNYYLYLWGLQMKLKDESTPEITVAPDEQVNGIDANMLRVEYEEDTYYFYFDKGSGRMLQYKFYFDEDKGKGEVITLKGEIACKTMKIAQSRSWYTLPEMKFLGTDILEEVIYEVGK